MHSMNRVLIPTVEEEEFLAPALRDNLEIDGYILILQQMEKRSELL